RSSVSVCGPGVLGHHEVVPSPSTALATEEPGAAPEPATALAPTATSSPAGIGAGAPEGAVASGAAAGCGAPGRAPGRKPPAAPPCGAWPVTADDRPLYKVAPEPIRSAKAAGWAVPSGVKRPRLPKASGEE